MAGPVSPYVDSTPWGVITIGGKRVPGVVRSINGARKPEEWVIQRPTIASHGISLWRGTKLAEAITIVTDLSPGSDYDNYLALAKLLRPKIGLKPPTHTIANAHINFNEITRVACKDIAPPTWDRSLGVWAGEIILVEYKQPSLADIGAAKAPKPGVDPNADKKREVAIYTSVAKTL